ncbi:MAG: molybdopterin biosynthesis protein [Methanomicrobiales archaeon]
MVKRYLDLISLDEARTLLRETFPREPRVERVPVEAAAGRVTAAPLHARVSSPAVHIAAMDGIAVKSVETRGAADQRPVTLGHAVRVNTGGVVPQDCDAVVMIEDVWEEGGRFTIRKPAPPWQHVRPVGEDIGVHEMILPSRHRIRPHELGALASYGIGEVPVLALTATVIPTGSELVPTGSLPPPGKAVESNSLVAAAMLGEMGVDCRRSPIVPDDPDRIREAFARAAAESDLLLVSAGSSAGTRDFTADTVRKLGEVLAHGVAIKPGKPVIIGRITETPVIGLPGYPLAAFTVVREIVRPFLAEYGFPLPAEEEITARLTTTLQSDLGTDEFVLLSAGRIGGEWVAAPLSRGAGVQSSAVRANARLAIPASAEGIAAGETVTATLMVDRETAMQVILLSGSHDPSLDVLADLAARRGATLSSAHTGSMGGILSLRARTCHAAPMHLLGPGGEYNIPFLERYLPGEEIDLICVAGREQGIVSREGIGAGELAGHTFINRQKGSGTRLLLDTLLGEEGIDPADLPGYDREVTTHLAVALAVASGEAECGMCVAAAARALNLPFVPVATERYELAVRREMGGDPRIRALIESIESPEFTGALREMGGFDVTVTGERRGLP